MWRRAWCEPVEEQLLAEQNVGMLLRWKMDLPDSLLISTPRLIVLYMAGPWAWRVSWMRRKNCPATSSRFPASAIGHRAEVDAGAVWQRAGSSPAVEVTRLTQRYCSEASKACRSAVAASA